MTSASSALRRPTALSIPRQVSSLRRSRALAPFSQRAFRAYATGQALTSFGTWVQTITQDWLVLTLTHSAQAVGLTAAFQFLPALLLGTYGGSFADRLPRKPLLVCTQLLNCAVAGAAAALTLTGQIHPWEIYVLAVAGG